MKITSRLLAVNRAVERVRSRNPLPGVGVCARIEELTLVFAGHPPTLTPGVEAGVRIAVDREERFPGGPPRTRHSGCG